MADKDYGVKVKRNGKALKDAEVIINTDGSGLTNTQGVFKIKLSKSGPIVLPIVIRGEGFEYGSSVVLEPDKLLEIEV